MHQLLPSALEKVTASPPEVIPVCNDHNQVDQWNTLPGKLQMPHSQLCSGHAGWSLEHLDVLEGPNNPKVPFQPKPFYYVRAFFIIPSSILMAR